MNEETKKRFIELLAKIGEKRGELPGAQECHKLLACVVILDLCEIKDGKRRDVVFAKWLETPSSLGCNASAFAQQLGLRAEKSASQKAAVSGL